MHPHRRSVLVIVPPMNEIEKDTRPSLTLTEAADACDVHRSTIRRALDRDAFPNAYREPGVLGPASGLWRIPVTDLIAAGYSVYAPDRGDGEGAPPPVPQTVPRAHELDELEQLRSEIAAMRARAELAEAIAHERQRSLEDLRVALRALGPGPTEPHSDQGDAPAELPPSTAQPGFASTEKPLQRRSWWQRKD